MRITKLHIRIAEEAQTWVDTPFYPRMAVKGVGADCVQLALQIYKNCLVLPDDLKLPKYNLGGGEHRERSIVVEWLKTSNYFKKIDRPQEGALAVFLSGRERSVEHHVGVFLNQRFFVHSWRGYGVRETTIADPTWANRLRSIWLPKVKRKTK